MPKAKVKDILTYATENRFGVAAINTLNIETVKYVIEAAERKSSHNCSVLSRIFRLHRFKVFGFCSLRYGRKSIYSCWSTSGSFCNI